MKWPSLKLPTFKRPSAAHIIYGTMQWSKASMPVLALVAAVASSIRTVQAIAEIYNASGTTPGWVPVAAFCFAFGVEGAIFLLALAQESQHMKWRAARKKRNVMTRATLWRAVRVRLGFEEPLTYDQIPESDGGLGLLLTIAFSVAIVTNLYLGLRPLFNDLQTVSLQTFMSGLLNANADLQLRFILDLTIALFPPFMERAAGHMTARFAGEVAVSVKRRTEKQSTTRLNGNPKFSESTPKLNKKGASERVIEYLQEHPEVLDNISQNQLAKQLDVSVGTVNAVFKARSSGHSVERVAPSSNGNGKH